MNAKKLEREHVTINFVLINFRVLKGFFIFSRANVFSSLITRARMFAAPNDSRSNVLLFLHRRKTALRHQHSEKLMVYNISVFAFVFPEPKSTQAHYISRSNSAAHWEKSTTTHQLPNYLHFLPGVEYIGRVIPSTMGEKEPRIAFCRYRRRALREPALRHLIDAIQRAAPRNEAPPSPSAPARTIVISPSEGAIANREKRSHSVVKLVEKMSYTHHVQKYIILFDLVARQFEQINMHSRETSPASVACSQEGRGKRVFLEQR
jgi:hypothetical protein